MTSSAPSHLVSARAPGKINLGLWVGPVRPDGYHPLLSAFQAVDLWEVVTVRHSGELQVEVTATDVSGDIPLGPTNSAWQAAVALAGDCGREPLVHISIDKSVPVAGGMAGGSADAAATLHALNALWGLGRSVDELEAIAQTIGSDVAFSVRGGAAIGRDRGQLLETVSVVGELHLVMLPAEGGLSTAEVYRHFDHMEASVDVPLAPEPEFVAAWQSAEASLLAPQLHNDLQASALELRPELESDLEMLVWAGGLGGLVSGSGPTLFTLAHSATHAKDIAQRLAQRGRRSIVTRSTSEAPGVLRP